MKKISLCKRILFALIAVVVFSSSNIFMSCGPIHELTRDEKIKYDSLEQLETGVPNKGGKFTPQEAFDGKVNNKILEDMEQVRNGTSNSMKAVNLLEIQGGIPCLLHNPNTNKRTTVSITLIKVDVGLSENVTLLNQSARIIHLAPGRYRAIFLQSGPGGKKEWEAIDKDTKTYKEWEVGYKESAPYPLPKGTKLITKKDDEYFIEELPADMYYDFQRVFEGWK